MKSFVFPNAPAGEPASMIYEAGAGSTRRHVRLHNESGVSTSETPPTLSNLLSQAETTNQFVITIDIATLQIIQQTAALANQFEQSTARMIVFLMRLEMIGEFVDALGQERHLNFRRTGIRSVCLVLRNDVQLSFFY